MLKYSKATLVKTHNGPKAKKQQNKKQSRLSF